MAIGQNKYFEKKKLLIVIYNNFASTLVLTVIFYLNICENISHEILGVVD